MTSNIATTLGDLFTLCSHLLKPFSDTYQLDAEIIITHICRIKKYHLISDKTRTCSFDLVEEIEKAIQKRIDGEPVAYIVGRRWFYKYQFRVTPAVLIPRPETELLVEWVVNRYTTDTFHSLLDICTGSGCIAISIAAELPSISVVLSDISDNALAIANENMQTLKLKNTTIVQSDLYENITGTFDIITANPPYLTQQDMENRDISVMKEPKRALDGGKDGVVLINEILQKTPHFLTHKGVLAMEIGAGQLADIIPLIPTTLHLFEILKDYAGYERHLLFKKK